MQQPRFIAVLVLAATLAGCSGNKAHVDLMENEPIYAEIYNSQILAHEHAMEEN